MLPARLHFSCWGVILPLMKSVGSVTKLNYHSVNQSSFVSWHTEVKEEQTEPAFLGKCCDFMFFHSFLIIQKISVKCLPSKFSLTSWKSFVWFSFMKDKRTDGRDRWDGNNRFQPWIEWITCSMGSWAAAKTKPSLYLKHVQNGNNHLMCSTIENLVTWSNHLKLNIIKTNVVDYSRVKSKMCFVGSMYEEWAFMSNVKTWNYNPATHGNNIVA